MVRGLVYNVQSSALGREREERTVGVEEINTDGTSCGLKSRFT